MKKIRLLLPFLLMCIVTYAQKDFNSSQLTLRNDIQSFLKTEGFQPSIDSDGDIMFKRQGKTYYVVISADNIKPLFVALSRYFKYDEDVTVTKASFYAQEIAKYKMCKMIVGNQEYRLTTQMFLTNHTAFTSIFYKLLDILDSAEEELISLSK